ncbi:hypothetical protein [Nocardia salmonicida]|uniref:hypothetical protein n=1 Tax=Nocardia salmonicida TaxID=53431 RepID=UPI000AE37808|nr:hypothetical protein [Nocardia salmonicida]
MSSSPRMPPQGDQPAGRCAYETLRVRVMKAMAEGSRPGKESAGGLAAAEREELAKLRKEVRDLE